MGLGESPKAKKSDTHSEFLSHTSQAVARYTGMFTGGAQDRD